MERIAATPGHWLQDMHLVCQDGVPVFGRHTNAFLKIHFEIPPGRQDEHARKVLISHRQEGNSHGIWRKRRPARFPQPELGRWRTGPATGSENGQPPGGLALASNRIDPRPVTSLPMLSGDG